MKLLKQIAMLAGFAFVAVQAGPAVTPAQAGTPADTLIMAKNIDDIITLDPANHGPIQDRVTIKRGMLLVSN